MCCVYVVFVGSDMIETIKLNVLQICGWFVTTTGLRSMEREREQKRMYITSLPRRICGYEDFFERSLRTWLTRRPSSRTRSRTSSLSSGILSTYRSNLSG